MKKRGRNMLITCFKPVVENGSSIKSNNRNGELDDDMLTYVSVGRRNKDVSDDKSVESSDGDVSGARKSCRKKRVHRSFSRVLKAVLFDTSLVMEIRKRKYRKNSFQSNSNLSSKPEKKISHPTNQNSNSKESSEPEEFLTLDSNRYSSLFSSASMSSSRSSSIISNSMSLSERNGSFRTNSIDLKQGYRHNSKNKKACGNYYSSNGGLYLLLVCLFVLIFWGKICAIICTSTWLLFAPRRTNGVDSRVNEDLTDIEWEEQKKRVVMEGFLERNRNRVL